MQKIFRRRQDLVDTDVQVECGAVADAPGLSAAATAAAACVYPQEQRTESPLGIPTMFDRAMQALWLLALNPVAETTADPNSYGFRPRRSTADAVEQCFKVLAKRDCAQWILEGDIRGCFDNISHSWMLESSLEEARAARRRVG